MLKDVTLGRYYPGDSMLHRADPRAKMIAVLLYMIAVFFASTPLGYGLVAAVMAMGVALSRVPVKSVVRSLRPILFIVVFTTLLNVFFFGGETQLVKLGFIRISLEGVLAAAKMAARIVLLVTGTSILTLTTSPLELTDGLERLMRPLKAIKFPVHEMSMMMSIAMRFIPTLTDEADRLMKAQAARGADFETGGLLKRARAMVPLLVPLFISAFRKADDLAIAMESRCYTGGKGRTRMKVLKLRAGDVLLMLLMAALLCGLIIGRL